MSDAHADAIKKALLHVGTENDLEAALSPALAGSERPGDAQPTPRPWRSSPRLSPPSRPRSPAPRHPFICPTPVPTRPPSLMPLRCP